MERHTQETGRMINSMGKVVKHGSYNFYQKRQDGAVFEG